MRIRVIRRSRAECDSELQGLYYIWRGYTIFKEGYAQYGRRVI